MIINLSLSILIKCYLATFFYALALFFALAVAMIVLFGLLAELEHELFYKLLMSVATIWVATHQVI